MLLDVGIEHGVTVEALSESKNFDKHWGANRLRRNCSLSRIADQPSEMAPPASAELQSVGNSKACFE